VMPLRAKALPSWIHIILQLHSRLIVRVKSCGGFSPSTAIYQVPALRKLPDSVRVSALPWEIAKASAASRPEGSRPAHRSGDVG
jgi:hypothetical protein